MILYSFFWVTPSEQSAPKRQHIKIQRQGITQIKNTAFTIWQKFEMKKAKRCLQHIRGLNTWSKEPDNASQHQHVIEQSVQPLYNTLDGLGFESWQR